MLVGLAGAGRPCYAWVAERRSFCHKVEGMNEKVLAREFFRSKKKAAVLILMLALGLLAAACQSPAVQTPVPTSTPKPSPSPQASIPPSQYVKLLGKGMDVDWAKDKKGIEFYSPKAVEAFKQKGFTHVRIRVKNDLSEALLEHLDRVIGDCLNAGLIPVLAYKAEAFKDDPSPKNMEKVVNWWGTVAKRYKDYSPLLSFDLIIEVTGPLSRQPETLNEVYERAVTEIRKTNPTRIIFISPRARSSPEYLSDLKIPTQANGYLMAEWHCCASGPSKTNPNKLWTTGTEYEKNLIRHKIKIALDWQKKTGIYTWVGAWMPGNYNKGNSYTVPEQVKFATFMSCQLDAAHIPFAINSDTKFYDRVTNRWIPEMLPVIEAVLHPKCSGQ